MFKSVITMKTMLLVLAIVATMIFGTANANIPFGVSGSDVSVSSYDIDSEANSIILQVQSHDPQGVLELTFERTFFDSILPEGDDEFLILMDGARLHYVETNTNSQSRTIKANLSSGDYEIEIFGSHLLGKTIKDNNMIQSQIKEQDTKLQVENELLSKQVNDLSVELADIKTENSVLESKNTELSKTIFNPDNLISETEEQAASLISETEEQAASLISETEEQAASLISETEEQTASITLIIEQKITAFAVWLQSLFQFKP